ncbi:hypothetical protein BGX23_011395 [Mortierella sp. AD031]|nr:hypothetical protein BGX23_011395 [Mortierella sp. AD031]KAG0213981.1 hypothetical protein BGX33_002584 [Mortierella sp. NVP41]
MSSQGPVPRWLKRMLQVLTGIFLVLLHLSLLQVMSSTELVIHTLALVLLPKAIGSSVSFKDRERLLTYYFIWFQRYSDRETSTIANQVGPIMPTRAIKKTTYVYLLVAAALVLNTCLGMYDAFREYSCNYGCQYVVTTAFLDRHYSVCFLRTQFAYTTLYPSLPLPETILIRATALIAALAWSNLPTQTIIRAWTRMWNSNNNTGYLRKIHYVIYMLPLKALSYYIILWNTVPAWRKEYYRSNRNIYLLAWTYLFGHGIDLVFGLALLWNLYAVHTCPEDTVATDSRPSQRGLLFESDEKKDDRSKSEKDDV